jgi:hypothetical protein
MLTNDMSQDRTAADSSSVAAILDKDVIGAALSAAFALEPGTRLLLGPAGGVEVRPALRPSRIPAQPPVTWRVPADTSEEWPMPAPVTAEGTEGRRPPRLRPSWLDRSHLVSQLAAPEEAAGPLPLDRARLLSADPVDEAVSQLLAALDQVSGTPEMAKLWDSVVGQVRTPRSASRGNPAQLYAATVVEAIDALTPAPPQLAAGPSRQWGPTDADRTVAVLRKQQVLDRVFTALLHAADKRIAGADPGDPRPEEEEKKLTGVLSEKLTGKEGGYREVRTMLLATFGALEAGTTKAIEWMNAFYAKVRDDEHRRFLGHRVIVHDRLFDRLKHAEELLTAEEKQTFAARFREIGSLDIRANRNKPFALSEHALGCAIDIDPERNPNVHDLPYEFIADVTGIDLRSGQEGRLPDVFDVAEVVGRLLPGTAIPAELRRPTAASTALREVFHSEASLAAAMQRIASERSQLSAQVQPAELLERVRRARWEGPQVSWRFADLSTAGHGKLPPGPAHDSLSDLLYPPKPGAPFPEPFQEWDQERHTAELLIMMADVYDRARVFREQVKGHPPATAAVGAGGLPQFAAYGIADLPPRLISVLRDGAGLRWLGERGGNRDFMHFELYPKDLPPLYPEDHPPK